ALADAPYYHGLLPREDIKMMLKTNGEFIDPTTEPVAGQQRAFVISVMVREEMEELGSAHTDIFRVNARRA
uniref:LTD domain-containing protein n=1 Tax=Parascaris univalens TaxID=6257 RepID=A0A915A1X8_PARUN